ncbi:hypothetical protein KY284_020922 [Solanum tuberosum]|nr:hypothetical protein KY284_020922 [Solanum tuberosum]
MEHEQAERKRIVVQVDARNKADYISLPEGTDLMQHKRERVRVVELLENHSASMREIRPTN